MSDWELVDSSSSQAKPSPSSSEWSLVPEEPQESLGTAAAYAIPRVAQDLLGSAYQGVQNIPDYWEKAKTEVPGFLNPMNFMRHPLERGKQSLAGLLELAQGINRAPKNIADYAANRLHLIPEEWANKIPTAPSLDEGIEQYLGSPKNPGDALARGLTRNADLLLAANALGKALPHLTKRGALKKLKKGKSLAEQREIGTLNVNPELIEDARQYLPNNLPERNLLNASQAGDYNSLFKLQSDVGKISSARTGKIKSLFAPESHLKGQAGLESRHRLLDAIHENLQGMGHEDISKLLREGQKDYRRYMKFRKYPRILAGAAAFHAAPKNALMDLIKQLWHA